MQSDAVWLARRHNLQVTEGSVWCLRQSGPHLISIHTLVITILRTTYQGREVSWIIGGFRCGESLCEICRTNCMNSGRIIWPPHYTYMEIYANKLRNSCECNYNRFTIFSGYHESYDDRAMKKTPKGKR